MSKSTGGPLAGMKIIEMAAIGPVPFAGMMLADMGADIIRVDRVTSVDNGIEVSAEYELLGRGRRSVSIDVKHPEGRELVKKLTQDADVIMEGLRPGVMERLGLGPDDLMIDNPKLIYARMTGWGQTGPMANKAGHDINYISLSGALASIGQKGGPPIPPLNLAGDYGGGSMFLVTGILAAFIERSRTGKGQIIDAAMIEGASYLMTTFHQFRNMGQRASERGSNILDSGAPFYRCYETADGEYMAVGPLEPKFYAQMLKGLSLDPATLPPQYDQSGWPVLENTFSERFLTKNREQWTKIFEELEACVTPVLNLGEALEHPHNTSRENFSNFNQQTQPNPAPRFSSHDNSVKTAPVIPGEHSREILSELGLNQEQIKHYQNAGVIGI